MAKRSPAVRITRWIARVWSILSIVVVVVFTVGAAVRSTGPMPTPREWVGLALWPIGVSIGLIVAWYREELGGISALGCLAAFYVWDLVHSGQLPRGPFFVLSAAPGILFLVAGMLSHRRADHEA